MESLEGEGGGGIHFVRVTKHAEKTLAALFPASWGFPIDFLFFFALFILHFTIIHELFPHAADVFLTYITRGIGLWPECQRNSTQVCIIFNICTINNLKYKAQQNFFPSYIVGGTNIHLNNNTNLDSFEAK